jgi:hypothetical protein
MKASIKKTQCLCGKLVCRHIVFYASYMPSTVCTEEDKSGRNLCSKKKFEIN